MKRILFFLTCLSIIGCNAQDSRELNIYLDSDNIKYFAVIYKDEPCSNDEEKLNLHIDSNAIIRTEQCFIRSNIITKHHFYVLINEKEYKEISYLGAGYQRVIDSIYVTGVESTGKEGVDIMIYRVGTLDEVTQQISDTSIDFIKFEERCLYEASK